MDSSSSTCYSLSYSMHWRSQRPLEKLLNNNDKVFNHLNTSKFSLSKTALITKLNAIVCGGETDLIKFLLYFYYCHHSSSFSSLGVALSGVRLFSASLFPYGVTFQPTKVALSERSSWLHDPSEASSPQRCSWALPCELHIPLPKTQTHSSPGSSSSAANKGSFSIRTPSRKRQERENHTSA